MLKSAQLNMILVGSTIGHYTVLSELGVGGMGKIFLAQDTELNRQVAIKILNDAQSKNEDILRRFKQEAQTASALNHPNIVTIYQIGKLNENQHFIAMEFVEGETLRSLLKNRKLTLKDALDAAIQATSALAAAHGAGIVHRDIKPENIMRRPDGLVKVLDFGLAKQTSLPPGPNPVDPDAPTQEFHITIPGMIMGTAAYMSPEQARGKQTDERTDIWSFGVVLYEMITGRTPFVGETKSDVMAAILKSEPETLAPYAPEIPVELEFIIKKTLAKELEERYQTATELLHDLKIMQSALNSGNNALKVGLFSPDITVAKQRETEVLSEPVFKQKNKQRWWLAVPAIVLLIGGLFFWSPWKPAPMKVDLTSLIQSQVTSWKSDLGEDSSNRAKFSPDGKLIAFVAIKNGKNSIWLKQIGGGDAFTRQQDESDNRSPIWSPDGGTIVYFSNRGGRRGIWTTPALGGSPSLLTPVDGQVQLIMWSKNGTIYFELNQNLYSFEISVKKMTKLTNFEEVPTIKREISVSPDEKQIVYVDRINGNKDLWIADLNGKNPTQITRDEFEDGKPIWHPDGQRIIYNSNRGGIIQICLAFLSGQEPIQLSFSDSNNNVSDISADGTKILYQSTKDDLDLWSVRVDDGKEFQLSSDFGAEFWQDVAPSNETLVYQAVQRTSIGDKVLNSLIIAQQIGGNKQRTELAADGFSPQWSPDGNQVAFLRLINGKTSLWLTSSIGGDARSLTESGVVHEAFTLLPFNRFERNYQWTNDSRSLIYVANRDGVSNLWKVTINGSEEKQLTNNEDKKLYFFNPSISPDGNKVAWTTMFIDGENKRHWSIWLLADDKIKQIHQSDSVLRLVGWSPSGNEMIFKSVESDTEFQILPANVNIFQIALDSDVPHLLSTVKDVYFYNIQLSPDRKMLAFAARQNGNSVIQILPLTNETAKTLIGSNDDRVYFSNLSFASDGKTIFYGKQANWQVISMIDKFK